MCICAPPQVHETSCFPAVFCDLQHRHMGCQELQCIPYVWEGRQPPTASRPHTGHTMLSPVPFAGPRHTAATTRHTATLSACTLRIAAGLKCSGSSLHLSAVRQQLHSPTSRSHREHHTPSGGSVTRQPAWTRQQPRAQPTAREVDSRGSPPLLERRLRRLLCTQAADSAGVPRWVLVGGQLLG